MWDADTDGSLTAVCASTRVSQDLARWANRVRAWNPPTEGALIPDRSLPTHDKRTPPGSRSAVIRDNPQPAPLARFLSWTQQPEPKGSDVDDLGTREALSPPETAVPALVVLTVMVETRRMKRPLRKLPAGKRRELDHAVEILRETFAKTVSTRKAPRLRDGKILKIVLFGSYARGDWVHDPVGRYFSDFDLLVVVDHKDLVDLEFWEAANERLLAEIATGSQLRTPVTFIVHDLDDVNQKVERGRYFFTDILRDGIVLFSEPGVAFVEPQPLTPATALIEAEEYFDERMGVAARRFRLAELAVGEGFNKEAAFELHQAVEALYGGLLLVLTLHLPKAHNLVHLRKMTEPLVQRLAEVWPHETKFQKRSFELLRAAYVKSRYNTKHYEISDEELAYVTERVAVLREIVVEACEARLAELRREA